MDRYELKVSLDEIDSLIAERRFAEAAELADTIDWTRVRGVHVLCRISDLYKINKRYKDSRDLMQMAYERNPAGRKIIYSLCELELKLNNYIHALQLYNAFINVAPRDSDRFLLQYKLYKKQDVNVYEQIAVLEEFLQHDFRERWAYELATLYLRAGEEQRCIRQCDEIVAYFGDGRFVIRALELKKSLTELNPQQEERLAILRSGGTIAPPPAPAEEAEADAETEAADPAVPSENASETGQESPETAAETAAPAEPAAEKDGFRLPEGEEKAGPKGEAAEDTKDVLLSRTIPADPRQVMGDALQTVPDLPEPQDPESGGDEAGEPEGTPEEYTDELLRDANMQETIARGMREIGDYDSVLAQETSGQLAMVMEEEQTEESQVEGQLDLSQIMSEWEKIRRESEQQRLAEARRHVLERSEAAKRELYGDGGAREGGDTRSWKKEDVEDALNE